MKNKKMLLSLFLLFGLTACGKGLSPIGDHFKNYTFNERANNSTEITSGINDGFELLSSVQIHSEEYSGLQNNEAKSVSNRNVKFFDDSSKPTYFIESVVEDTSTVTNAGGVKYNETKNITTETWQASSNKVNSVVKTIQNGKTSEAYNSTTISDSTSGYKSRKLLSYKPTINVGSETSGGWFKKADGSYIGIFSSISETVSAVDWGKNYKELKQTTRTQRVYKVDKNLRLTEYYLFHEQKSNRDNYSGKWYGSQKVLMSMYERFVYRYEKRDVASIDILNSNRNISTLVSSELKVNEFSADFSTGVPAVDLTSETMRYVQCTYTVLSNGITRMQCSVTIGSYLSSSNAQKYSLVLTLTDVNNRQTEKNVTVNLSGASLNYLSFIYENGVPTYICNQTNSARTILFTFEYNGRDVTLVSIVEQ